MKRFELVTYTKRRTFLLQRTSARRLVTGIAILSSLVLVGGSRSAVATELPDAGTTTTPTLPPVTPLVVVTPTEGGGTATVHLGGDGGTVTVGTHDGNWSIHGNIGDPFGEGFHLTGDLDSADWRINGGLGIGGGVTVTVGTGTGGTTGTITTPIGGNGGTVHIGGSVGGPGGNTTNAGGTLPVGGNGGVLTVDTTRTGGGRETDVGFKVNY